MLFWQCEMTRARTEQMRLQYYFDFIFHFMVHTTTNAKLKWWTHLLSHEESKIRRWVAMECNASLEEINNKASASYSNSVAFTVLKTLSFSLLLFRQGLWQLQQLQMEPVQHHHHLQQFHLQWVSAYLKESKYLILEKKFEFLYNCWLVRVSFLIDMGDTNNIGTWWSLWHFYDNETHFTVEWLVEI